jgi:hypothetical protein
MGHFPSNLRADPSQRPHFLFNVSILFLYLVYTHSLCSAWIGSLQFALIFMPGSITGRLLDMGYYKLPLGIASVFLVLCALLTAQCTEYWQFLLCQGFGCGVRFPIAQYRQLLIKHIQLASGFIFPPTLGLVSQWCTFLPCTYTLRLTIV